MTEATNPADPAATAGDARRYASRKFLLTATMLTAATVLLAYERINAATWSSTTTWIMGLYMAGNVGTWAVDALRAGPWVASKP